MSFHSLFIKPIQRAIVGSPLTYPFSYRIESFGIKLLPPDSWHMTFTLSRLDDQPPISAALAYPMSDQLDDWRDYQHQKITDRGEDFTVLREMLNEPRSGKKIGIRRSGEDMERGDSGYFSRRSSKLSTRINSLSDTIRTSEGNVDFTFVAEGTPSSRGSECDATNVVILKDVPEEVRRVSDAPIHHSAHDHSRSNLDTSAPHQVRTLRRQSGHPAPDVSGHSALGRLHWSRNPRVDGVEEGTYVDWVAKARHPIEEDEEVDPIAHDRNECSSWDSKNCTRDRIYEYGVWHSASTNGLDGVEEEDSVEWVARKESGDTGQMERFYDATTGEDGDVGGGNAGARKGKDKVPIDSVNRGEEAARRRSLAVWM